MATEHGHTPRSVVVVGIDFSELSEGALKVATGMVANGKAVELHLIHVLASYEAHGTEPDGSSTPPPVAEEVRTKLADIGARVAPAVRRMIVHVRAGKPDVEIAQLASDLRADLIMIGAHSRNGFQRAFGSVANSLVHHAACPVLTFYSRLIPLWERIEPPCPECLAVQDQTSREQLWCPRHSQHHAPPHTYAQFAEGYGLGAQTFR